MNDFFRRQLAIYADYHRDPRNCMTHYVGIPLIFFAVVLALSLWRVSFAGWDFTLAMILLLPAIAGWMALDAGIAIAMLIVIVPLAIAADLVARIAGAPAIWVVAAVLFVIGWALQIVGHMSFERRRPALVDNVFQMFVGPMFMTARMLTAFGLRPDLAAIVEGKRSTLP